MKKIVSLIVLLPIYFYRYCISPMLAKDFRPNRIDAAKAVATEFINSRPNDNIGLVIFASESFTQCPLTTNHVWWAFLLCLR